MIGIFDSGYGGLTIIEKIRKVLPQYDYVYLGDNARTPYGTRSFEVVYEYTLQCVQELFAQGCELVILACNTASAKALRTIQQRNLPLMKEERRVLGVIRPTVEVLGTFTQTRHVGLLATPGTIQSETYTLETHKLFPDIALTGVACPMWVPLIENGEHLHSGADYFVKKNINELFALDKMIDTVVLGCTHYPLLLPKIEEFMPQGVRIVTQGDIVATSLADYLQRHPEIEERCSKGGRCTFFTTESVQKFTSSATIFLQKKIDARQLKIG